MPFVLLKTQFTKLAATCEEDCDCGSPEEQPIEYDRTDVHPVYEAYEDANCAEEGGGSHGLGYVTSGWW